MENKSKDLKEIISLAETIDSWSLQERKDYLFNLVQRELKDDQIAYRTIMKMMLVDDSGRKEFLKNEGKPWYITDI